MTSEHPKAVGGFEIESLIGSGAGGRNYRARDPRDGTLRTVRLLDLRASARGAKQGEIQAAITKLGQLAHPNVQRLLASELDVTPPFLVLEHVAGTTLRELLKRRRLTFAEATGVFKEICRGLAAAHSQGIVHLELSPAAVLVNDDLSVVKLTDFAFGGLHHLHGGFGDTQTASLDVSMIAYTAPELAQELVGDRRADIYSAGVLFYEILTGVTPRGRFSLPSQLNSTVPSEIDPIVLRCLSSDPQRRYPDASQLLAELRGVEEKQRLGLATNLQQLSRKLPARGRPFARLAIPAIVVVLLATAVGLAVWLLRQPETASAPGPAVAAEAEAPTEAPSADGPAQETEETAAGAGPPEQGAGVAGGAEGVAGTAERAQEGAGRRGEQPAASTAPSRSRAGASAPSVASPRAVSAEPEPPTPQSEALPVETATDRDAISAEAAEDLAVIRRKLEDHLYPSALVDARALAERSATNAVKLQALVLQAWAHAGMADSAQVRAVVAETETRFKDHPELAPALFGLAQAVLSTTAPERTALGLRLLRRSVEMVPAAFWAPRALLLAAQTEVQSGEAAAAGRSGARNSPGLETLRQLVTRYPQAPEALEAWRQLGTLCEEAKLFREAGEAFTEVARRTGDAETAWRAARLLERADAPALALVAYRLIGTDSKHHGDAQKRIAKLSGR